MDPYYIFISYASADNNLAQLLCDSLGRIVQFRPYKAENYPSFEVGFKQRIQSAIINSFFVIALLTESGKSSQFVNQELGFALAVKFYNKNVVKAKLDPNKDIPIIIPISRKNVDLRGFITKDSDDILFLENFNSKELLAANVIFSLRKSIYKGFQGKTLDLNVYCTNCHDNKGLSTGFTVNLPPVEIINDLIQKNKALKCKCPKCGKIIRIDARTFLPLEESIFEDVDDDESVIGKR
ncbi:MAG: toll/interleukin-1 receptor domain-containing protein [Candidatus Bathyarchaeota archaeon]|nr:toll/interleukin-1 receptor domain-containing protein [Candidatus Bathyarchaeota archaeon]